MKGITAFEKIGQLPDDIINEYIEWFDKTIIFDQPKPKSAFAFFMTGGWGVAILCVMVSLSVLSGIIWAGLNPPVVTEPPTEKENTFGTEEMVPEEKETVIDSDEMTERKVIYEEEGIQYTSNGDSTCYVSGFTRNFTGAIMIPPSTSRGETVTAVGDRAFYSAKMTEVSLPDTLTSIGEKAFWGCMRLKGIAMCEGLLSIGKGAFEGCTALTTVTIPEGVVVLQEDTFYGCYNLATIHLPAGILSLEEDSLTDCTKLSVIYYKGTAEMWEEVDIWSMFALNSVQIRYES
ncbi:MAG: leucine-rich repeat domain-containing protein [Clostridia bacterium]|nr:leucine-rich repeat domain-containing protein [Clostridia bacterium]